MKAFKSISPPSRVKGLSLIELGVVMVIISLALVPLVQMIGGPNSQGGQGNAQRLNALRSKEMVLANALIERALSSDFGAFNCNNGFDPATSLPTTGQTVNLPAGNRCTDNTYNDPLYYQWTVRNADNSNAIVPTGNHYYQVVLNVWNQPTGGAPLLTLPTTVFWNEAGSTSGVNTTGIAIVQDISGSMVWGSSDGTPGSVNSGGAASPYLKYRYTDPAYPAYTPDLPLDINDNTQLDVVSSHWSDEPQTPWDDQYIHPGILGIPLTLNENNGQAWSCANANPGANSKWWSGATNPWNLDGSGGFYGKQRKENIQQLCGADSSNWSAVMNENLSRIEAARSSLLNFLVSTEADPELYQNTKLAFLTFSTNVQSRVPLESVNGSNRYPNMRKQLTWLNRTGPGIIPASGSTNMYAALQQGAQTVFSDPNLDNRIVFLVTDGAPTVAPTGHASFINLATQIGNGTFPGANGKKATIFTLGLLSSDPQLPIYLRDDIANRTPGGQFFFAQNVGDVGPMFAQIKYQIQRVILMNKSNRYNVDFG
jgi:type II secretory pathway pseudopilin PulG